MHSALIHIIKPVSCRSGMGLNVETVSISDENPETTSVLTYKEFGRKIKIINFLKAVAKMYEAEVMFLKPSQKYVKQK